MLSEPKNKKRSKLKNNPENPTFGPDSSAEGEPSPYFDEVTISEEMYSSNGKRSFSLWLTPQTVPSALLSEQRTGRGSYLPIDQLRSPESNDVQRINKEYEEEVVIGEAKKVGLRVVNRDATGGTIGFMAPWSTSAETENVRGVVEALALLYPDQKIVLIETPGMGASESLTKDDEKELKDGSFAPMADQIAATLKEAGYQFNVLFGVSEGARVVTSLSSLLEVPVCVTVDPPGTDKQSILKFGKRFMIDEGAFQAKVKKVSPDAKMVESQSIDQKIGTKEIMKGLGDNQLMSKAVAMSRDKYLEDVEKSINSGTVHYDFRASDSTIASHEKCISFASKHDGYYAIVLNGAKHAVVEMNPFATALLLSQALDIHRSEESDQSIPIAKRLVENDLKPTV